MARCKAIAAAAAATAAAAALAPIASKIRCHTLSVQRLTINRLPDELLLHIFSFVAAAEPPGVLLFRGAGQLLCQ